MEDINVKIICKGTSPSYGTPESAGADVYATTAGTIEPGMRSGLIPTGVSMRIPKGYYCHILPRSGLAHKYGINVLGGCIDSDYVNEVFVILQNNGGVAYNYNAGDRIAQFVFKPYVRANFIPVATLDETERHGGFGSTGV